MIGLIFTVSSSSSIPLGILRIKPWINCFPTCMKRCTTDSLHVNGASNVLTTYPICADIKLMYMALLNYAHNISFLPLLL